jgi:ABC-type branched-subunit amino acid transport system ATPase component
MLRVRELTVAFGGVKPLDTVSLELSSGVCGLVGPNGAGKTTLFNVLSGFVRPAGGAVEAEGASLLDMAPHRRARWGLRRTFQQEQVIHALSAYDNVRVTADEVGAGDAGVREALAFVGLGTPDRRGGELSMLERRLVEVAKSVVGRPRIVLLDEPGAGLAEAETERLVQLIRQIPERYDAQVILVDHDMELVSAVCSTTAVLDFGRVIALGPTSDVLADEHVRRAYLGTEEVF